MGKWGDLQKTELPLYHWLPRGKGFGKPCMFSCTVWFFAAPWTVAHQIPLSMEFSRREYWSRSPFPSPGNLPSPGMEPTSLLSPALSGRFLTTEPILPKAWDWYQNWQIDQENHQEIGGPETNNLISLTPDFWQRYKVNSVKKEQNFHSIGVGTT